MPHVLTVPNRRGIVKQCYLKIEKSLTSSKLRDLEKSIFPIGLLRLNIFCISQHLVLFFN